MKKTDKKDFRKAAEKIGKLLDEKNAIYGSSVEKSAEIMRVLFPESIPASHYEQAMLVIRIIDKLSRISNIEGSVNENESPFLDISGYGIYGSEISRIKNGFHGKRSIK